MTAILIRKIIIRPLYYLALGLLLNSCGGDPNLTVDVPDPPELTGNTAWDTRIKELYEHYGIWFRYDVPREEVMYSLYGSMPEDLVYTEANKQDILTFLDVMDKLLFRRLPEQFLKENLPMNVLIFDEFRMDERILDGHITANALMFAKVGALMKDTDLNELYNGWISLLFEKMVAKWEYPSAFAEISQEGYEQFFYWEEDDIVAEYAILRHDRTTLFEGIIPPTSVYQDFGDFVAFSINATTGQKEEYYRKNPDIRRKEELIGQYFQKQFGFRLPTKTE